MKVLLAHSAPTLPRSPVPNERIGCYLTVRDLPLRIFINCTKRSLTLGDHEEIGTVLGDGADLVMV